MKANNTILIAASLVSLSACGAVGSSPTSDDEVGSGSGSGSAQVETTCAVAADCAGGTACDLAAHECVTDALTLEDAELVNDGLRYWSTTSGPKLVGSFHAGADAVVQVKVGSTPAIAALSGGDRWSVQLPAGTIQATDTLVTVTLTDPANGVVELAATLALDSAPPTIANAGSSMHDERGDLIDFASGVPVHDHQGQVIDLSAACPKVYKYAYLMDTHAPIYGGEVAPNPIAWELTVQDTRVAAVEMRLRDAQDVILRDWTAVAGTGAAYPVTLFRDGDAGLGAAATKAGKLTVDVRARDWGGLEATSSYCVDFEPLAAPLKIEQASTPTDADALKSWALPANSPISRLTNANTLGAAVVEQKITQVSSEPVVLSLGTSTPTGSWQTQFLQGWIASVNTKVTMSCTTTNCSPGLQAPTSTSWSGQLTSFSKTIQVVDSNNTAVPTAGSTWVIPGRAAGAPPVEYRVRVRLNNVTHFGSNSAFVYGEFSNGGLIYTGTQSSNTTQACSRTDAIGANCTTWTTYQYIRGINTIGLTLNPLTIQLGVAASQATAFAMPVHVAAATFVAPAMTWDGGDENSF